MSIRLPLAALIASGSMGTVAADELSGQVSLGWRDVSVSGSQAKYAEDVNLDDGPRLFDAALTFRPQDGREGWPDLIEIDLQSIGGDPYESTRFEVRKYGAYRFRVQRRRSEYFYDDIIVLPEEASISGSTGGDFHRFDFERVRDDVTLDIQLSERAELGLGFERFEKWGTSTSTLDVQRDEFEFERPIDESIQVLRMGLRYNWEKVSLSLEERLRDYENQTELFLPGFSVGENPTDLTTLDFFFLNQPYAYRSHEHVLQLATKPTARFEIKASAVISNLDLDANAAEQSQGIDFLGNPFTTDAASAGGIDRDLALYGIDLAFAVSDRVQLIGGLKRYLLDQSGDFSFSIAEGGQSTWDIDTVGFDIGFLVAASTTITFSAGWTAERRDADVFELPTAGTALLRAENTDSDGFFGMLDYRPNKRFNLAASVDDSSIDNPLTLASPNNSTRYRIRAKYRFENGISFVVSHSKTDRDNEVANWSVDTEQSDIRVSYTSDTLALSIGGSLVDVSRDFERLVTGGTRQDQFRIRYNSDSSYLDAAAHWKVNDRWVLGGNYRAYDNDGSFNVKRDDVLGFIERKLPQRYALRISYRNVDFGEGGIEDYEADIVEIALGFDF